ncbi:hypothetical protein [Hufsiella ginkgonis]|uniref:Fibronectin type-III domain-containing protein n=1 Tax=Hufsiella ginkgonis TaxID=2695274 RepID=A0A7K1XXM1_9SPHI|nr:hypothetical protein [Hufsiella ginkgonis]MXV15754.1 hypothetical protein [Hufsiella ginkgonis]
MKHHHTRIICGFLLMAQLYACTEFIEPSVAEKQVTLLAPADQYESGEYMQNFWWDEVEYALSYRFQVVTPSFGSPAKLVLDTLISGSEQFRVILDPGLYEWRVRAENGSSHTAYATRGFRIYRSSIKEQQVILALPANNTLTNQADATYSWSKLYGSTRYRLQVDTNNFADESKLVFNATTPNLGYTVPLSANKIQYWRVRAENDTEQSKWSDIYKIVSDQLAPATVALTLPDDNKVLPKPVSLQWAVVTGTKSYELVVMKSDSATPYSSAFPVTLNGTSYSFNESAATGKLYWKVRAIDEAGNRGAYSAVRGFTIQ